MYQPHEEADRLAKICEQFAQCQNEIDEAVKFLPTQRSLTPSQCKQDTAFLKKLELPIEALYELLKSTNRPSKSLGEERGLLTINLDNLKKYLITATRYIDDFTYTNQSEARQQQETIIRTMCKLNEPLDRLMILLGKVYRQISPSAGLPTPSSLPELPGNTASPSSTMQKPDLFNFLSNILTNDFERWELEGLCHDLCIPFGDLEDLSPRTRAQSLTRIMYKSGNLDILEKVLRQKRKHRFTDSPPQ